MVPGRIRILSAAWVASVVAGSIAFGAAAHGAEPTVNAGAPTTAREHHVAAKEAFNAGRFDESLDHSRNANALEPSPVYDYQIGRSLEALGRLHEAYSHYIIARSNLDGHPHADEDLHELVDKGVEGLQALHQRTVLRVEGLVPNTTVQVDGHFVADADEDVVLDPGARQICFTQHRARWSACLHRTFTNGRRVTVAMPQRFDHFARLDVAQPTTATRVRIDDSLLLVHPAELDAIYVEPGPRVLLVERSGGRQETVRLDLLTGDVRPLDTTPGIDNVDGFDPSASTGGDVAPWVTVGIGAALVVTSATLLGLADAEHRAIEDASRNAAGQVDGISQRDAFDRWDAADDMSDWGVGLGAVGVAAVGAGLLWMALDEDAPAPSAPPAPVAEARP